MEQNKDWEVTYLFETDWAHSIGGRISIKATAWSTKRWRSLHIGFLFHRWMNVWGVVCILNADGETAEPLVKEMEAVVAVGKAKSDSSEKMIVLSKESE